MIVKIGGQSVPLQFGSLEIDDTIGQRSTVSFSVMDKEGTRRYYKGQPVEIFEDDAVTKVFGGVIDKPVSRYITLGSTGKIHNISCTDWHYLSDKRIVAKLYSNQTAGNIVRDIITNYLSAEGIVAGTIQDGPTVTEAIFNYISSTRCLESLAELAAFEWYIDQDKKLHFLHRATNYNDTVITETSDIKNVQLEPVSDEYRNKQYIRAGMDTTDTQTETKKGDGTQKTFTVAYKLAVKPTVKVDGVTQTVGIKGLETGFQWYWNKGENIITQDDAGTPLTSSQTLTINYKGLFDIVVVSYDAQEINRIKDLEGGTGIHENVMDDPYLTSRVSAFESANAKLARYAKVGNKITFDTKITGLRAGHLIRVDLDSFGIDDYFLIESVRINELGTHDNKMIYKVTVVDGNATGGWAKFFKQLAERGQAFVIRENIKENEVLTLLEMYSKTWTSAENPNIFREIFPGSTLFPGSSVYPSFAQKDRVKYIVFYNSSNVEIFRKAIAKKTETAGQIVSTAYISPFEANGIAIAQVGWIGGSLATGSVGSGVIIDKKTYSKTKTNMESLQIDKTDIKGW